MTAGPTAAPRRTVLVATTVARTHEAFLLPHVAELVRQGHRVVGLGNGLPSSPAAEHYDRAHHVPLERTPSITSIARAATAIRRIVLAEQVDLAWFHTPLAAAVGRAAMATIGRRRRPLVAYMAHGFHFGSVSTRSSAQVFREIERVLSPVTDHLQTVNREDYERARRFPGRTASNTELTRGVGIDLERFSRPAQTRQRVRSSLDLTEADHAVFIVGDLHPEKRVGDAIAAVASLGAPYRLFVVGEGRLRDELTEASAALPAGSVTFLGYRRDLPDLLAGGDVLVHPSSREGLPTVVLEAQASGLPVVGAACRGTADLLAHGAGILHPIGRIDELAAGVQRLVGDDDLRARLVRTGRQRAARHQVDLAVMASLSISLLLPSPALQRR